MSLLLISGPPGVGKSTFCRWLAEVHGYVHVETDVEWADWGPLLTNPTLTSAVTVRDRLRARGPDVASEWGFRPDHVGRIGQLASAGFSHWWFDGDAGIAKAGYLRREGGTDLVAYQRQVEAIAHARQAIERAFEGRVLRSVTATEGYVPPEQLFARIQGTGPT